MSVLRVPRLFFKGSSYWNPNTTNNNDQWPTYDFPNADLNWPFLATQSPPPPLDKKYPTITRENFRETFKPWVLALKDFPDSTSPDYQQPPAEWNYFGGNDCGLVNPGTPAGPQGEKTVITGGQTAYGADPAAHGDPVLTQPVQLAIGSTPSAFNAPKMVDVNPDSSWCTRIYLSGFQIGDPSDDSAPWLTGQVPAGSVMSSRWIYFQRNLNVTGTVQIAGVGGTTFQIGLPWNEGQEELLKINVAGSNLLQKLQDTRSEPGTRGVMVRLIAYTTLYFTSQQILEACPELEACAPLTGNEKLQCQYEKLAALWDRELEQYRKDLQTPPSQNPAVSTAVGSIGVWEDEELATAPQGRYLSPHSALTPQKIEDAKPVTLGPAVARLDGDWLSIDMSATISEIDPANTKASYGTLRFGVEDASGNVSVIGRLTPEEYGREKYDATAGIVDFSLEKSPDRVTRDEVETGRLVLQAEDAYGATLTALGEAEGKLTVDTDQRGVYVDEGGSGSCTVQVRYNGLPFDRCPPPSNVLVHLVQYRPDPPPPAAAGSVWKKATPEEISARLNQETLSLERSSNGEATFTFDYLKPGFPIIVMFPYFAGQEAPPAPDTIGPLPSDPTKPVMGPNEIFLSAFYMTTRCMPKNNDMPQQFVDLWNKTFSQKKAWGFVYERVFFLYDMVFPVMQFYAGINFGDMDSVIQNWKGIASLISTTQLEQTSYMPVTRQLSNGARCTLQLWGKLVENDFKPDPLSVPPDCGKT